MDFCWDLNLLKKLSKQNIKEMLHLRDWIHSDPIFLMRKSDWRWRNYWIHGFNIMFSIGLFDSEIPSLIDCILKGFSIRTISESRMSNTFYQFWLQYGFGDSIKREIQGLNGFVCYSSQQIINKLTR